jgi:hypothetical protein
VIVTVIGAGLYPTVVVPLQIAYGGRERPVRLPTALCRDLGGAPGCDWASAWHNGLAAALVVPDLLGSVSWITQAHASMSLQARDPSLGPGFSKKGEPRLPDACCASAIKRVGVCACWFAVGCCQAAFSTTAPTQALTLRPAGMWKEIDEAANQSGGKDAQ